MGLLITDPNVGGGGGGGAPAAHAASHATGGTDPIAPSSIGATQSNADATLKRLVLTPDALTGSAATSALSITQTLNTTGAPDVLLVDITNTASGANTTLANFKAGGVSQLSVGMGGRLTVRYVDFSRPFVCGSGSAGFQVLTRSGHNMVLERGDSSPMAIVRYVSGGEVATGRLLLSSDGNPYNANAFLSAAAAATWQFGENHATAPVAQTIQGPAATSGNNNGGDITIRGGAGSGSGLRGNIKLHGGNRVATIGSVNNTPFLGGGDFVSQIAVEQEISAHAIAINNILLTLASHGLMEEP